MIRLLTRFFDDIHAIRLWLTSGPITIQLCEEDRKRMDNWRRSGPRVKKETV